MEFGEGEWRDRTANAAAHQWIKKQKYKQGLLLFYILVINIFMLENKLELFDKKYVLRIFFFY